MRKKDGYTSNTFYQFYQSQEKFKKYLKHIDKKII